MALNEEIYDLSTHPVEKCDFPTHADKLIEDCDEKRNNEFENLNFQQTKNSCNSCDNLEFCNCSYLNSKLDHRRINDNENIQSKCEEIDSEQTKHNIDTDSEEIPFMLDNNNLSCPEIMLDNKDLSCPEILDSLIQDSLNMKYELSGEDSSVLPSFCSSCNLQNVEQSCHCHENKLENTVESFSYNWQAESPGFLGYNPLFINNKGFESVLDTEEIHFDSAMIDEGSKDSDHNKSDHNKSISVKISKKYNKIKSLRRRNLFEKNSGDMNEDNAIFLRQKSRRLKEKKLFTVNGANECLKWLAREIMCFAWIVIVLTVKCIVILLIILAFYCLDIAALVWFHLKRLLFSEWVLAHLVTLTKLKLYLMEKFKKEKVKTSTECEIIPMPTSGDAAIQRLLSCKGKNNPYSILGVSISSTDEEIKKVYRKHAILVHPDKCQLPGAEEAFKILNNAFEMIGEPENRKNFDSQSTEVKQQEAAMAEFTDLLTKLKSKIEDEMNLMFCNNCNKCHKRILLDRPLHSARFCKKCSSYHPAKNTDLWAETSIMGFLWHYYSCMDEKIYDVTEWASCQIEDFKMMQANSHNVLYHISTKGNRNHYIKQEMSGVEAVMQKLFNMSADTFKDHDTKSGLSQNSTNINKKKFRKKKH